MRLTHVPDNVVHFHDPLDTPDYCDVCEKRVRLDDTCGCHACERCGDIGKWACELCGPCEDAIAEGEDDTRTGN